MQQLGKKFLPEQRTNGAAWMTEKGFTDQGRPVILLSVTPQLIMGDFFDPVATQFPLQLVASIVCTVAVAIYAILQPGEESDDDDTGTGGGGMMQPIAIRAR